MADDIVLGARQLTNKENKYPSYDTERPVSSKIPGGGTLSIENYDPSERPHGDTSNPGTSDVTVKAKQHPLVEHFNRARTARRHFGAGTVTEN
jgi:hypothetical protein